MELRKIQVTGGSTHVVSLPKKWVDRNHLKRSDTLAIHEEPDGSLLVIPHSDGRPPRRTLTLHIPETSSRETVVRRLVGAYLAGADEINVHASGRLDPMLRQTVRALTRDLVGVEILEESSDGLVLQDLVGVSEMDLRKTITRMHRIARLMFDEAQQTVHHRDLALAADVSARDDELDRLEWMVSKQMHALLEQPRLAARLNVRPAEALNYFLVSRSLERMGDHASKICRNVVALQEENVPTETIDAITQQGTRVAAIWDEAFTAMKKPDFDSASHAADDGKEAAAWRAGFTNHLRTLAPAVVGPLTLIADSVDRVRGYAIDIAEVAMNHTFQPQSSK